MKIAILCDHYPLSPRVIKVRNSILKINNIADIRVFAWNRENKKVTEDFVYTINDKTGYGNKIRKLINLLGFRQKIQIYIQEFQPDIIHSIDFEMLTIANSISKSSGIKIIYEVYDIKFFSNPFINLIRKMMERKLLKNNVNGMILASPFFIEYYQELLETKLSNTIILNNKPSKTINGNFEKNNYIDSQVKKEENAVMIGFVGTIRYKEILINLIDTACKFNNIKVLIAGGGPEYKSVKKYVDEKNISTKVFLTGQYDVSQINDIYNFCDYIWAAYPSKDLNVKYAVSNKFFESMAYGKQLIVSKDTLLGDTVEKYSMGYTVNPYEIDSISKVFQLILNKKNPHNNILKSNIPDWLTDLYWESEEDNLEILYKDEYYD
ncbi:glycosyltransferase [Lysinibacillus pakistanensis]|uniref:glycosyltransferase n=1 Tax=Lysinibacillus pakistanensis TaxID=759811 RepID=UPI003D27A6FA